MADTRCESAREVDPWAYARPVMHLVFRAIDESAPGEKWRRLYERFLPAYREWFLREGDAARPTYRQTVSALREHMPELVETYEALVDLAGGGDLAARLLGMYRPTPYLAACSQAVIHRDQAALVRNYDYSPDRCEGTILRSAWNGSGTLAMSDCLWGVLDGINEAGLAVALAFGGRRVVGDGFGIPLVLRYVLELCATRDEAVAALSRIPVHMAYNVTLVDAAGEAATVWVGPDRPAKVAASPVAANHQGLVEWDRYAKVTSSPEREAFLEARLSDPAETVESLTGRFLLPPLFTSQYARGWGTLYTAVYRPKGRSVDFVWPGLFWPLSVSAFEEGERVVEFVG